MTRFEARSKALGRWHVILSCNRDLEDKYIHENMNDMFTCRGIIIWLSNKYIIMNLRVVMYSWGMLQIVGMKVLWWVIYYVKYRYDYKMSCNYILLRLRCVVWSENYCGFLIWYNIWFEVELVVFLHLYVVSICLASILVKLSSWVVCLNIVNKWIIFEVFV